MDAWMYGCLDAWMHECLGAWVHGCMDAWMHGCMDAWMHGCMDGYPLVTVALRDHPLQHDDVALQVLHDGLLVQLDGAAGGRALGRRVGELEGLRTATCPPAPRVSGQFLGGVRCPPSKGADKNYTLEGLGREGLLALELREALDLQDAAVEDVLLALLLNSEEAPEDVIEDRYKA